jgi:hypothetical protein
MTTLRDRGENWCRLIFLRLSLATSRNWLKPRGDKRDPSSMASCIHPLRCSVTSGRSYGPTDWGANRRAFETGSGRASPRSLSQNSGNKNGDQFFLALLGGEQRPLVLGVARLTAGSAWRFRPGADWLGVRVFGRGRLGGIGGVLVEALLQFMNLLLQGLQLPLILLDEERDRRLCCRRDLVPKFRGDRWPRTHATDLQAQLT